MSITKIDEATIVTTTDAITVWPLIAEPMIEGDTLGIDVEVIGTSDDGHATLHTITALYVYRNATLKQIGTTKAVVITDSVSSHWTAVAGALGNDPTQLAINITGDATRTVRWTIQGSFNVLALGA